MSDTIAILIAVIGFLFAGFAVVKAWRAMSRKHEPDANNNWVNEGFANRKSSGTWEKDG